MKHVDHTGLYIMVFIAMIASCENKEDIHDLKVMTHELLGDHAIQLDEPVEIVQQEFPLPDFCLEEYRYPRSDDQARKCFELLVEEIQGDP